MLYGRDLVRGITPMSIEVPPYKELSAGDWGLSCRLLEHLRNTGAALRTLCSCDWIYLYGFAYPSRKLIFFKVSNPVRRNRYRVPSGFLNLSFSRIHARFNTQWGLIILSSHAPGNANQRVAIALPASIPRDVCHS
jgi:hypothetical protein